MSIVIPVRDSAGLPPMLRNLPAADEMIVVTAEPAEDAAVLATCTDVVLVRQSRSGVGNALACGFAAATGDIVVALDGDGATDPAELPRYVAALVAGADVALGSRYTEGGRDLTDGRFRRALNLALIWLVNVLYGVHRTDPGFGYTAFWRDTIDHLGLPDPSPAAPATWGDGPEIEALLTVRTAARGLTVTEVPGVAYPRMRRAARADRTTVRHWLRVLAGEFRGRTGRPPRHAITLAPPRARAGSPAPRTPSPALRPLDRSRTPIPAAPPPVLRAVEGPRKPVATPHPGAEPGTDRRALPDRRARPDRRVARRRPEPAPDHPHAGPTQPEPAHPRPTHLEPTHLEPTHPGPADLGPTRPGPVDLGLADLGPADIPGPLDRVVGHARPVAPAENRYPRPAQIGPGSRRRDDERAGSGMGGTSGERTAGSRDPAARGRDEPPVGEPRREVGIRRRRLEAYRQRPDLRVINGEGTGSNQTRSGRLRAVPRETTGGCG